MKVSKYNFEFNYNNLLVIFNALSGGLLVLDDSGRSLFEKVKTGYLDEKTLSAKDQEKLNVFKYGKIVLEDDFDEFVYIRQNYLATKYAKNLLNLTLTPTMACNMRCVYCFERAEDQSGHMTDEVANDICDFVKKRLDFANQLFVCWFGGEPLLNFKHIQSLSRSLMDLTSEKNSSYGAYIITNGTLLTPDIAKELVNLKIFQAQVSIDGFGEYNNQRRKLKNGQPSYDVIIKNLADCCDILPILVRVGLDKENVDGVMQFFEDLKNRGLQEKINTVITPILSDVTPCHHYTDMTFQREDFAELYIDLLKKTQMYGNDLKTFMRPPEPRKIGCGHHSLNTFSLDQKGKVYGCLEHIGQEENAFCSIRELDEMLSAKHLEWLEFDPLEAECQECSILPLCLGGCTTRVYDGREKICSLDKYVMLKKLEIYITDTLSNKFNNNDFTARHIS